MSSSFFRSNFALPTPPASNAAAAVAPAAITDAPICASDLPLILLPVRLETRFFPVGDGTTELRVRVYPDKIHIDSHEPDLLQNEVDAGMKYWDQDWHAGPDTAARATAWAQLADAYGAERAAWIARVLRPTNPDDRPKGTVAAGTALQPAIVFPNITAVADPTAQVWRHAPQARLLPDRWLATITSGVTTIQATGKDIARPLNVGPDPTAAPGTTPLDQLGIDAGMKWMVDFSDAEAKGMALRISLPAPVMAAGIDNLMVYGVAASINGEDSAAQLANLLDAHHYTDGLDFLRYGTPTNNTDERRAPQLSDDPGHARSFAIEVTPDPSTYSDNANTSRVATALGLATTTIAPVLGHVGAASDEHERHARSMNAALWQVGWGYYLTNIVGFDGTGLTVPAVDWAREHFVNYVRASGPYPTLRTGRQPYGILPVTSIDLWQPRAGDEAALAPDSWVRSLLIKLRDTVWRTRLGDVFRIGRRGGSTGPNPDADLADVMRTDGVSSAYATRGVMGRHYLQHLRAFTGEDIGGAFLAADDACASTLPNKLGFTWRPRASRMIGADSAWPVTGPLIQPGDVSPWNSLEPNYIGALLSCKTGDLLAALDPNAANAPKSMLEAMLRHGLSREIANAAARLAAATPADLPALLRDAELNDLVTGASLTQTWKRQLALPSSAPNTDIQTFLDSLTNFDALAVAALGDFRRSLAHLQTLDSESLQYLMQSTLDLSSHRLDAWITSFATKRLATMRNAKLTGAYVGAYGWVENLHPAPSSTMTPVTTLPVGETGSMVMATNDSGFIHAPSLTHAAAAAVLRNAHLGPSGVPSDTCPFAIDISSRRVRDAEHLLDGVRSGQPIGALLGYRLERGLHELGLDVAIPALRSLVPLAPPQTVDANTPTAAIAANNVVDGLALWTLWTSTPNAVTDAVKGIVSTDNSQHFTHELDALTSTVDALTDALTAEAAYQIARGNTTRTAATLASIAKGDAPPPELEVAQTPRTGTPLTHRVMTMYSGTANLTTPGWPAWNNGIISSAEPILNFWAAKVLGDGSKTMCTVERIDDATGAVAESMTFKLNELGIEPLQFLYGVEASNNGSASQPVSSLSYIEQLVVYQSRHRAGAFAPTATVRVQHARPATLAPTLITLFDMLEQAKALRLLLANARGIDPEDLNLPDRAAQGTIDLAELEARVMKAEDALNAAHKTTIGWLAPTARVTSDGVRTTLIKLGVFNVGPAVPANSAGDDPTSVAALLAQAASLSRVSGARVTQIVANRAQPVATDPRARMDQLVARMKTVFGDAFVVLPHFTLAPTGAAELKNAMAASTAAMGGDALGANSWITRYARVRDSVARFATCMRGADVLGAGDRLNLSVAQLPFVSGERWIGLPPTPGTSLPSGKLSLVVQAGMTIDTTQPLSGIMIDEWTELVPSDRETTALTFQFDPPDSTPPQSVLIAVPPVPDAPWTSETLRRVLLETLDLAKLRAVDPELLGETAQYLPALYMAFNVANDAVSTDFATLTT
jgi:hypothetical protein